MWKNIRRRRTRNPTWTEYVHLMVSITKDQHIHPIQFSWRPLSIQELCEWNQWKKKARRMEESWKVFRWKLIPSLLFFCFSCERQFNWKWNLSMTRMFIYTGQLHWLTWWILEDIWSLINNRLGSGREGRRTSSRSQKQTNMDLWHLNISHLSGCTYCHLWPLSKWFWRKFIVIAHESHVGSFFLRQTPFVFFGYGGKKRSLHRSLTLFIDFLNPSSIPVRMLRRGILMGASERKNHEKIIIHITHNEIQNISWMAAHSIKCWV